VQFGAYGDTGDGLTGKGFVLLIEATGINTTKSCTGFGESQLLARIFQSPATRPAAPAALLPLLLFFFQPPTVMRRTFRHKEINFSLVAALSFEKTDAIFNLADKGKPGESRGHKATDLHYLVRPCFGP
jgi:hypothetical protein